MDVKVSPINISLLGTAKTYLSARPRPVKITFSNSDNLGLILRSQIKLKAKMNYKDLCFVSDCTRKQ